MIIDMVSGHQKKRYMELIIEMATKPDARTRLTRNTSYDMTLLYCTFYHNMNSD